MRLYLFTYSLNKDKTLLEHLTYKRILKVPYMISQPKDQFTQILLVANNKKEANKKAALIMTYEDTPDGSIFDIESPHIDEI